MYQVWSKFIEGCRSYSVHKDVTEGRKDGRTEGRKEGRKEGRTDGRTDGNVTLSLRNFVGEGIIKLLVPI